MIKPRTIFSKRDLYVLEYTKRLNQLLNDFHNNISSSAQDNQELFDMQNNAWKAMANKANRLHKGLDLPFDAFEKMVTRNHYINKINSFEPRLERDFLNTLSNAEINELVESETARLNKVLDLAASKANSQIPPLTIVK